MNRLIYIALFAALVACSDASGPTRDSGGNDSSIDAANDSGPVDAPMADSMVDTIADAIPPNTLALSVPAGTKLCGGFAEQRDWQDELALLGQLELKPTTIALERTAGSKTVPSLFASGVLSSSQKTITFASTAELEATVYSGGWDFWTYKFKHTVTIDGSPAELTLRFEVGGAGGQFPSSASINDPSQIDFGVTTGAELKLGAGMSVQTELQNFSLCEHPDFMVARDYTGTAATGDAVKILVKNADFGCYVAGNTSCLTLNRAEVTLNSQTQVVTDRLRLVYDGNHHNWDDDYLVLLSPPLGNVHAVLIETTGFGSPTAGELVRLDASFNELGRDALTWQPNP